MVFRMYIWRDYYGRALFGSYSTRSDDLVLLNQCKVLGVPTKTSDPEIGCQPRYEELIMQNSSLPAGVKTSPLSPSNASTAPNTPSPTHLERSSTESLKSYNKQVDRLTGEEFFFNANLYQPADLMNEDIQKRNLKKLLYGPYYTLKTSRDSRGSSSNKDISTPPTNGARESHTSNNGNTTSEQEIPNCERVNDGSNNSSDNKDNNSNSSKKPEFLVCKEAGCCCIQYFKYALVEGRKEQKLSQRDIVGDQDLFVDLLVKMLEYDQHVRLTCAEALRHPYLEGY